ncbi:hypothetical protein [Pseudomonas sp. CFBP 13727]|uniref:hypothetical protein n=1 Tax=Pseudomonas sp. CFBP 13727 TaxID=2775295 RepID=UPI001FD617E0|nr:hypothetical protein [Pseudomonas sp. CFBP 13727]
MKYSILASLLALSLNASAAQQSLDLPSCDIKAQRELVGETGGKITDPRQAHISVRANILSADIGTTRKTRKISQAQADRMIERVEVVRHQTDQFVHQQGFLSAAEKPVSTESSTASPCSCASRRVGVNRSMVCSQRG